VLTVLPQPGEPQPTAGDTVTVAAGADGVLTKSSANREHLLKI